MTEYASQFFHLFGVPWEMQRSKRETLVLHVLWNNPLNLLLDEAFSQGG